VPMPSGRERDGPMALAPRRIPLGRRLGRLELARVSPAPPPDVHTSELARDPASRSNGHDGKAGAKPRLYAARNDVDAHFTTGWRNQRMRARILTIPSRGRSI
jgi:hypothetical protein